MKNILLLAVVIGVNSSAHFNSANAAPPEFYGTTAVGGTSNKGVLFSYDPSRNTYQKLHDFDSAGGANPISTLQELGGTLYGLTSKGGSNNTGVLYSYNTATSSYSKLHDFNGADGASPYTLFEGSGGKLYGLTYEGGTNGYGVLFSYAVTSGFEKLHDFNLVDGAYPTERLIQGPEGIIYGLTYYGGIADNGVIYSFDPVSGIYAKLHDFDTRGHPIGAMTLAPDGKFYGYAAYGTYYTGMMYSYDVSGNTFEVIQLNDTVGDFPSGAPVLAQDGKLYCLTSDGAANGVGALFSYDPANPGFVKLFDFGGENGSRPGSLITGGPGKLYGTTPYNSSEYGVLFSFDYHTLTFTKLHDFEGSGPEEQTVIITYGSDGRVYGTKNVYYWNTQGFETPEEIFSYDVSTGTFKHLYEFGGDNGISPGALVEVPDCTFEVTCPDYSQLCYNATGKYAVPALVITGHCAASAVTYAITGATTRTGSGADASGSFDVGTSTIKWTVTGSGGNLHYCQSMVTVNRLPAVSIPNAWAVKPGGSPNTVYIGYGAPSIILQSVTREFAPYSYKWSTGDTTPSIVVSPATPGTHSYTLSVMDSSGCKAAISKQVKVIDVRCGRKKDKVSVCLPAKWNSAKLQSICVSKHAVASLLKHGFYLCDCHQDHARGVACDCREEAGLIVSANPNPASGYFTMTIKGTDERVSIRVADGWGRVIEVRNNISVDGPIQFGHNYRTGIYYAEIIQGKEKAILKLVKQSR